MILDCSIVNSLFAPAPEKVNGHNNKVFYYYGQSWNLNNDEINFSVLFVHVIRDFAVLISASVSYLHESEKPPQCLPGALCLV